MCHAFDIRVSSLSPHSTSFVLPSIDPHDDSHLNIYTHQRVREVRRGKRVAEDDSKQRRTTIRESFDVDRERERERRKDERKIGVKREDGGWSEFGIASSGTPA